MRLGRELSRRQFGVVLGGAGVALLAACSSDKDSPSGSGGTAALSPIRVALSTPLLWPTVPVADRAAMWKAHGLSVTMTEFPTGNEANQSLLGGSAEVATVAPTPVVLAAAQGAPVRVIGLGGYWDRWRVQARRDSGIDSLDQLKGKRIGVALGTSSQLAFERFVTEKGLTAKDFTIVNVRPPDMVPALKNGSVDAVNIWQPFTFRVAEIVPDDKRIDFEYTFRNNYLFVTTQKVLDQKRDELRSFLATMDQAVQLLGTDRDAAVKHVAAASGLTEPETRKILEEYEVGGRLDDGVVEEMKAIQQFSVASGSLKDDSFDVSSILVPTL